MRPHTSKLFVPLLLAAVLVMAGCEDEIIFDDQQTFEAELMALNAEALPGFSAEDFDGEATFAIENGTFTADVNVTGVEPGIVHPQHIHFGAECPPPTADDDGNGIVDVPEGAQFYGPILVPLDFDLSAQAEGAFPMAEDESYEYTVEIPIGELIDSLQPEDDDIYAELGQNEMLNLAGRTVVIHGVSQDFTAPEGYEGIPGKAAYLTVPIACGEIQTGTTSL